MGRHMAGLRAPMFAMAGMHNMPISKFWLWDGLGLCVSAPVVIGIGWWLADKLDEAQEVLHDSSSSCRRSCQSRSSVSSSGALRRNKPVHEH